MITLIFCGDLKYCPYINRYIERLDNHNEKFEVLFWNRSNIQLSLPQNYYYYDSPSPEDSSNIRKIKDFIGFRIWILRHLKSNYTDGLILLTTLTGILLFNKLEKFKFKYIFDIRDFSYENIWLFRVIQKNIINNSYFTTISSKGYKEFLPKKEYIIAHNFNRKEINDKYKFEKYQNPIRITFNGTIRYFDFQKKIIDVLKNDVRFELIYHGDGTELSKFQEYCNINNIHNVFFTGTYDNQNKNKLLEHSSILNNYYGSRNSNKYRFAISNKFYDGLIYHIPQLVESDGYKASITSKYSVGFESEINKDFPERLIKYYNSINHEKFDESCCTALDEILEEDNLFIRKVDDFISRTTVGK